MDGGGDGAFVLGADKADVNPDAAQQRDERFNQRPYLDVGAKLTVLLCGVHCGRQERAQGCEGVMLGVTQVWPGGALGCGRAQKGRSRAQCY